MDRDSLREVARDTAGTQPPTAGGVFFASVATLGLLLVSGCSIPAPFTRNDFGPSLPANASAEQIVRRVNVNIEPLVAWRSNDVRISGQSMPVHLGGQIAVERPRNFRLTAGILGMDEEADFGSNHDWFWFWVKRGNANGQPSYVYQARHEDVPNSQMLSQIPFQPDWLMEALGVVPVDPQHVTLRLERNSQYMNLISERLSPSGQTVKKVIRVDLRRGVILSHSLHDLNGNLIARARLDQHFRDKQTGIIMPHLIALEWPQANLKINLEIGQIDVNPTAIPPGNWQVPKKPYYPPFDIGALSRRQTQTAVAGVRGDQIDTASSTVAEPSAGGPPPQFGAPSPLASPNRTPTGRSGAAGTWPEADGGSEWNQPLQASPAAAPGAARGQISPFDPDASMPPTAKASASTSPKSATADNPFADPPVAGSQSPPHPSPASPALSTSGSSNGDPFESLPH
ncbi:MAG TPA: hypothetical protein VEI07_05030 [Planctomycetaceae bacterium]|nr:hypothetical protein [Planctomycetaceae bacterium]